MITLVVLLATLLFSAGVLIGWTLATTATEQRSRRQASTQQIINEDRALLAQAKLEAQLRRSQPPTP